MKRPIETFSSLEFLTDLMNNRPGFEDWDKFKSWGDFINLLAKDSKLKLSFSKEELAQLFSKYPHLMQPILNAFSQSQVETGMLSSAFLDEARSANPYKFLFGENKIGMTAPNSNSGIPSFTTSSFGTGWDKMSNSTTLKVSKNYGDGDSVNDWTDFKKLKIPVNSMILCDPYIFSYRRDRYFNLLELLGFLIGTGGINEQFDLTILFSHEYFEHCQRETLDEPHNVINNFLRETLGVENLNLSLVNMGIRNGSGDRRVNYHDRHIHTNSYTLVSSNSFNFFDTRGDVKQNNIADVELKPATSYTKNNNGGRILQPSYFKSHLKFIDDIIAAASTDSRTIGSCTNRLLSWAKI